MHIIVRLFSEITIKSAPVRKRFIKQLRNNLRDLLRPVDPSIRVTRDWEKLDVMAEGDDPQLIQKINQVLATTPGIAHFSLVHQYPLGDQHDVFEKTMVHWKEALTEKTFCVRVKRTGSHDFSSTDLERYVGGGLNQHTEAAGVRLKNPDVTVQLEVKDDQLYVVEARRQGLGGFPIGTQDSVLSLISGGFDSTVSSYLTIKRGLRTHYCFFNLGGREHELGVKEVAFYLWNKFGASHKVRFVTVPFEEVVGEILKNVKNSHMGVVLKRMMLRAAEQVAEQMDIQALVTGESVAQVSSQTLTNLSVIDKVTDTLVLRPLITMDKNDIIDISRKIGTEEFAAAMPEYCGVISKKPTTGAKMADVLEQEANFDFSVLERAVEERRLQTIDQIMADTEQSSVDVEILAELPEAAIVVDIRHPDEVDQSPLKMKDGQEVVCIPFYSLSSKAASLKEGGPYYLYCDKGIMSRLHASHLADDGYQVGVYRP
ncbi:tRNA uracil 4-sulfurtransferase ThiI [Pseudoteredinibacter isoporae]|uniref:tRNA sulfurtransferase n=1 Tax=Pseudoteredinibacter isoporae TaxID=570281 RepID=A0A7X0MTS8_9GAMM|nr:tRNA uracil 4-sulfurtransferase ThiI [Pseudoteredinibacter isoporae]MBB6519856.1 thiamine biosynthesis protein ThiI [Pseudoteredinibacter isoporae]NHO85434.1 tRNA 4-thiouridine(8) synthase ThiI [Pseudoteredinibacter isoporae]NIB26114.1 tRNA 4-thiouridine(8) synthase ThiI [Pseudoteredinibacter isoporae]